MVASIEIHGAPNNRERYFLQMSGYHLFCVVIRIWRWVKEKLVIELGASDP